MEDSADIMFSQYAQDPLENFTQQYQELLKNQPIKLEKKRRQKRELTKKKMNVSSKSFVISKEHHGIKLIQIKILDLQKEPIVLSPDEEDIEDNVVLSAQYVVQDSVDEITDLTEVLVRKISKKLCGDMV
ncbi:hypothetical protein ABMA27_016725 [Loxostege sticticalis]|uniref:Uncharacterized protein n=1 Tax=Loxostege sticticalis TaxID=481309 RepID=A0ABR3I3A6_LOXSC